MNESKTILVTGGAGFIGANFVYLERHKNNYRIVNLDKLTYAGNLVTLAGLAEDTDHIFIQGDISDRELVDKLLNLYQPQAIVNFAAETHVDRSIDSPASFVETNVNGTFNLLESARNYWRNLNELEQREFRFLHVSTDEVFGSLSPTNPPFSETTPLRPQ